LYRGTLYRCYTCTAPKEQILRGRVQWFKVRCFDGTFFSLFLFIDNMEACTLPSRAGCSASQPIVARGSIHHPQYTVRDPCSVLRSMNDEGGLQLDQLWGTRRGALLALSTPRLLTYRLRNFLAQSINISNWFSNICTVFQSSLYYFNPSFPSWAVFE
jgi:hypothetical protein